MLVTENGQQESELKKPRHLNTPKMIDLTEDRCG